MPKTEPYQPIDYLVIGHITQDLTPNGPIFGGTASYAALTAKALGQRVGIVTALPQEISLAGFEGIAIHRHPSEFATTFENIHTPNGRIQFIHHHAPMITVDMIPDEWLNTPVVHLGPIAREVSPDLPKAFPNSLVGFTPQGWLRDWDGDGRVFFRFWPEAKQIIHASTVTILSIEDLRFDERQVDELLTETNLLVVTEGAEGARLYWNGDLRRFRPPHAEELDPTGAGDIFATAFFQRLQETHNPWEAARFATILAATSVTRPGLQGVPKTEEVEAARIEILNQN
jgi:sugar/nucleoside kinase (ribokinase family)